MANDKIQQRNTSQKTTSFSKNAKQQNPLTSGRRSSANQLQPNRIRPQANTASYAGPTQASKAKRTDKVELNLPTSASFTYKKEHHNDGFTSLPRSSPSLTATTSQRNKLVFGIPDQVSGDQQSRVSSKFGSRDRSNDSKCSPNRSLPYSVQNQGGGNRVRELVGEHERRINNKINNAAIGPRTRSTTSVKSKKDNKIELSVSSVESPKEPTELNVARINGTSLDSIEVKKEQLASLYDAASENAAKDMHSNKTGASKGKSPLTDDHAHITSQHQSFETELDLQRSTTTMQRLQRDFNELTDTIREMSQPSSHNFLQTELLRRLMHNIECSPEATNLCSGLVQLIEALTGVIQMLNTQQSKARQDQTAKEHNLSKVDGGLPLEDSYRLLEQSLKKERKQRERVEHKLELLKKKAEEMYQPDLEKKNKILQTDLRAAQMEKVQLKEQVQKYKQHALDWESERNTIQTRAEKETSALQHNIEQQQKEMIYYIEEYHNKMKDEKYWNAEDLHKIIGALKRELDETMKHFDETKLERAHFEEEIIKLEKVIELQEKNYIDLANGVVREAELDEQGPKYPAGQSNSRLPRYRLPDEVMKREAKKAQLRIEQKKRRDENAAKANFDG
jgi:hypothetical protein